MRNFRAYWLRNRCSTKIVTLTVFVLCIFAFKILEVLDSKESRIRFTNLKVLDLNKSVTHNLSETDEIVSKPDQDSAFLNILKEIDWKSYEAIVASKNQSSFDAVTAALILVLSEFVVVEPLVLINSTCQPLPLLTPDKIDCSKYPTGFTGNLSKNESSTTKIGILIQFGFDVDTLEIYLHEMFDVVDRFFIIEATRTHKRAMMKPLIWDKVKFQPRFLKFARKIVHLVMDDADIERPRERMDKSNDWKTLWVTESLQESLRWSKFLEWNSVTNFFGEDDVLGFGDADEIPSRQMVNMIKYCQLAGDKVDIGIWFPFGNIRQAFATDFPIKGHKYTYGEPTFYTLRRAIEFSKTVVPSRDRGRSKNFLLGGIHMTYYSFLPFQILKQMAQTEATPLRPDQIQSILEHIASRDEIHKLELQFAAPLPIHMRRIVNVTQISDEMKDIAILPWFYDCNRDRYPMWEGKHDTRLDLVSLPSPPSHLIPAEILRSNGH